MKNIWHFPTWYPDPKHPALGSFVKKQVVAAANFSSQLVFFVYLDKELSTDYYLTINREKNLTEIFVGIIPVSSRFGTLRKKYKAYKLAILKAESISKFPDVIHAHSISFASFFAQKTAKNRKINWLLSEHWSGYLSESGEFSKFPKYKKLLWKNHALRATKIISVSHYLKNAMVKQGFDPQKFVIIPNVVEGFFDNKPLGSTTAKTENHPSFVFLNVSDLVDNTKNISGLLNAFDRAWKKHPQIELWIIGDGIDAKKLKNKAKNLPSKNNICFLGQKTPAEVLQYYPKTDCTVINSNYETFSVVAAESLFAGKPVIVTQCGGPEEFVNEKVGLLIPRANEKSLENALTTMLEAAKKFDSLTLHLHIKEPFSEETVGKKLNELYS